MTLNPITVQKSLDDRLTEYSCIFSESAKTITALEVQNVWSDFIELAVKNGEWQALWKIPRATCELLNIDYPTVVFVEVEELNCSKLSALVTIMAVEDDIELPEQHEALLIHLHPTVQQRDTSLCIQDIAQCLDNLRFFYNHIWLPWDDEDDKNRDWVSNRLEPRMKLFRDMQAGVLGSHTVSHIRSLLREARSLHKRKSSLEMNQKQLLKPLLQDECCDDSLEKDIALELMELKHKWDQVHQEIEMMENPVLRETVIERHQKGQTSYRTPNTEQYFVIWKGSCYKDLLDVMSKAHNIVPEKAEIKPCSLKNALSLAEENDTILLCQGIHKLNEEMILMRSGRLKGFPSSSEAILTSQDPCATLVDWGGARLKFSDLSLTASVTQALVVVRSGVINARSCQFICDMPNSSTTGVCIMPGGTAELVDCDLSGFDAAIAVHAGATISLIHCRITSCAIGIQVYDGAEVYLKDCLIQNCSEYGIVLRTVQNDIQDTEGCLQLLEGCKSIVVENSKMQGNTHGDVLISAMPSSNSLLCDINMELEESSIAPVSSKSDPEFENESNCSIILN